MFWDPGNGPKYGILSLKQGYFRGQNKAYFGAILGVWPAGGRNWAYFGGHFGAYFGPVCIGKMGVFGLFWGHFGPGWGSKWACFGGHFGPILGCFWGPVSQSWATLDAKNGVFLGVSKWQHGFFSTPKRVKNGQWGDMGSFWEYKRAHVHNRYNRYGINGCILEHI